MKGLRAELARVGIRGRLARRIEAELDHHLACDPDADVGDVALIADRFAAELRVPATRRSAYSAFVGLALAAAAVLAFSQPSHVPDIGGATGTTVAVSGLFLALAAQVALVAGGLAVWGVRRGTGLTVVHRRVAAALAAGLVVVAAATIDAVALRDWVMLAVLLSLPVLAVSAREVRLASGMTAAPDTAARGFAAREAAGIGALVVAAMVVGSAVAEHSWVEGVSRGALEALAFTAGYLVLGRRLGIRR